MKGFMNEFKAFIAKGNILDMSVGIVIGGAFGKIVSSLVNDLLMPVLGIITGRVDLTSLSYTISGAGEAGSELSIKYGLFLQSVLDFLIIAFSIFLVIKFLYKVRIKKDEAPAEVKEAAPSREEELLTEIRDLMKAGEIK